jgi:3-phenylpropionate/trans-cinnamate dioxygenase ferredoxin reductase subunit
LFPLSLFGHRRIRLEMWRGAREQAEYAAHNLIGGSEAFEAVPWFWSNQFDLTLQVAGLPGFRAYAMNRWFGNVQMACRCISC